MLSSQDSQQSDVGSAEYPFSALADEARMTISVANVDCCEINDAVSPVVLCQSIAKGFHPWPRNVIMDREVNDRYPIQFPQTEYHPSK